DTPNVIASTTWGHSNRRMVTWIRFLDRKTKKEFYFWNTHFDHRVQPAREKAALLVNKKVATLKTSLPVILVGDFNASAGLNAAYDTLTEDGGFTDTLLSAAKSVNTGWNTMNGFRPTKKGTRRIDWVLAKGPVKTSEAAIVLYDNSKQYPSDHQPVTAVITLE
ncbi:MAG: endonuclease, partial [Verrucomicrobiales bacterium]